MEKVSLVINLTPRDYNVAIYTLPHQLRLFGKRCNEIILVMDTGVNKKTKDYGSEYDKFTKFIEKLKVDYPQIVLDLVDYSDKTYSLVNDYFFKSGKMPILNSRGRPFYLYFYGLYITKNDFLLHLDADMIFGGGSQVWIDEAINIINNDNKIMFCNPLAGAPIDGGKKLLQPFFSKVNNMESAFLFKTFSTRIFLMKKSKFYKKLSIRIKYSYKEIIRAIYYKHLPYKRVEIMIGDFLAKSDYFRMDFLGKPPGLWSIHPVNKDREFIERLPDFIDKIEKGEIPDHFRGQFNLRNINDFYRSKVV